MALAAWKLTRLGTDFLHKNRVFAMRLLASLREHHGWSGRLVLAGTHIPHGSSLILTHSWDGQFPGLTSVPPADRPPVAPAFFAFRIMLAIGFMKRCDPGIIAARRLFTELQTSAVGDWGLQMDR